MPTIAFSLVSVRTLPIRGASGVTASAAGVLLVEDDLGLYRLRGATATLWAGAALHEALGDLEGVASDETGRTVWAISEERGTLVELRVAPKGAPRIRRVATLERPGSAANKGFEGLAYVPARFGSRGRAALVAVHEHRPRRVCLFELPSLTQTHDLKLPSAAKAVLDDLADVAVDPVTGAFILLSEASRTLAVVQLADDALHFISAYELPLEGKERPEGLAFVSPSQLVVVTEAPARLVTFRVTRGRPRR